MSMILTHRQSKVVVGSKHECGRSQDPAEINNVLAHEESADGDTRGGLAP